MPGLSLSPEPFIRAILTKARMCLSVYSAVSDRDIEKGPGTLQRRLPAVPTGPWVLV